jgi:hypothetical protein
VAGAATDAGRDRTRADVSNLRARRIDTPKLGGSGAPRAAPVKSGRFLSCDHGPAQPSCRLLQRHTKSTARPVETCYGPQLKHGHSCPQREHSPSDPGAGSHTLFICSSSPTAATPRGVEEVLMTGGGVLENQWTWVRPLVPWTASKDSMQSQVEVLGQRPRHLSATAPSDHSTPSAIVPVPRTPAVSVWRTNRKSRACRCIVFTSAESPGTGAHNRCGLWAVRTAHRPHAL